MTRNEQLAKVADALLHRDKCPDWVPEDDDIDPCDGLDGCEDCLKLAAEDVLAALSL